MTQRNADKRRGRPQVILSAAMVLLGALSAVVSTAETAGGEAEGEFAIAHDGCRLHYRVLGQADGPALFIAYPWTDYLVEMTSPDAATAETGKAELEQLLDAFADRYRIVHFDYPRGSHPTEGPLAGDLTPETVVKDFLAVADAAGVDRFALTGFSFSANYALQLATHTDRVAALAIGGWPPLSGPYEETLATVHQMLESGAFTGHGHAFIDSIRVYYETVIAEWDEAAEVPGFDMPRMIYVGDQDTGAAEIMGAPINLAEPIVRRRAELESQGWEVVILEDRTHFIPWAEHVATVRGFLDEIDW